MSSTNPPVAGMSPAVWRWLRETTEVRQHVVARVRASLDAGERPTPDQVAVAILHGGPRAGPFRPFRGAA